LVISRVKSIEKGSIGSLCTIVLIYAL
jgi:hypothetical protein